MPKHFQIAVIGSGPGGYVAALKAARMGAKTAVIEKHHLGGTCLNYGCIPSKALLASAELLHRIENGKSLGVSIDGAAGFDWAGIQKRKDRVLATLRGGIKGLLSARKVERFSGRATLNGPGKILIEDAKGSIEEITADKIIIAVGSIPSRIPSWPSDTNYIYTSDEALHWDELPKRLLIVGGGVIGCEFACMMSQYGVEVTIVEMMDELLPEMETDLGNALASVFEKRGIGVHCGVKVESIAIKDGAVNAAISGNTQLTVDKVLVATGRCPNTADFGLESIGIETADGFIRVNDRMETPVENYYCIGDANGRCLLAHAASAQGVTAVKNALGGNEEFNFPIPSAVYTFPEIGSVGMTTKQAVEKSISIKTGQFPIGYLGKAMVADERFGFVKVIRRRDTDELLGVHIIGHNAAEIIGTATAMLTMKAGANELADMVFAHPTIGEAVREAAEDAYDKALHLPPRKISKVIAQIEETG